MSKKENEKEKKEKKKDWKLYHLDDIVYCK